MKTRTILAPALLVMIAAARPLRADDCGCDQLQSLPRDELMVGPYLPPRTNNCPCPNFCCFHSEQEKLEADTCRDTFINWGDGYPELECGCVPDPPCVLFMADALFLMRSGSRQVDFQSRGSGPDNANLSTRDFDFGIDGAPQLTLVKPLGQYFRLEAVYFGQYAWSDQQAVRDVGANTQGGTGNLHSPFFDFGQSPVVGVDFNDFASIDITSQMQNFEINLRQRCGLRSGPLETSWIYGLRYMKIDEGFTYFTHSNVPAPNGSANLLSIGTQNDLYGLQLGGLATYQISQRGWFELDVKGAFCQNSSQQNTTYAQVSGQTIQFPVRTSDHEHRPAFIGDLSLTLNHLVTKNFSVRCGYRALWVDGVALAPENFTRNLAVIKNGPAVVNHNGVLAYHGPQVGFVVSW